MSWCSCTGVSCHLLLVEDGVQRSDLTVFVNSEHFTQRTGGGAAGDAVDVDLLVFMSLTHRLLHLHLRDRPAAQRDTDMVMMMMMMIYVNVCLQ